jgi:hypothetical protein
MAIAQRRPKTCSCESSPRSRGEQRKKNVWIFCFGKKAGRRIGGLAMIPRMILQGVLTLVLLSGASCVFADDNSAGNLIVGGPCTYKEYKGHGHITAIKQKDPNDDSYEVRFQFHPDGTISEPFAQVEGSELPLHRRGHKSPRKQYLEKNGIEVGKDFDSVLHVIVKGTCTPTIFEFPSLAE